MSSDPISPARRLTRDDWIDNARKVLVASGIEEVKVDRLAKRMRVTRGSFYWHFEHRKELLDTLLSDWEARNYFELAKIKARWAQKQPDLSEVILTWIEADASFPVFDMAIRVWARKTTAVRQTVRRVDDTWIALLQEMFLNNGYGAEEAEARARVAYFHQVGYYALDLEESLATRIGRIPMYYLTLTGREPPPELIEALDRIMSKPRARGRKPAAALPAEAIPVPVPAADHALRRRAPRKAAAA